MRSRTTMGRCAMPPVGPLTDWGDRLHDRFSLPFFLDLRWLVLEPPPED